MSFDFEMKGDASSAIAESRKLEAELGKIESKARQVGTSINDGFTKAAAGPIKSTTASVENLTKAFVGLNAQFKAEAAALDKILGPQKRLETEFRALDMLYAKGTITARQYIEQLEKLGFQFEKTGNANVLAAQKAQEAQAMNTIGLGPTPKSGSRAGSGSGGSGSGGLLGGASDLLAMRSMAMSAVDAFLALDHAYAEVRNTAMKFADAEHSVNRVIDDQLKLAHGLHAGLKETMEIYDAVRDGTDELNLSYEAQIRLTKSLGEIVKLGGKSISEASGLMTQLSYAFATGTMTGGELKKIMKQYPDLAELWTKQFGVSRKGLIDMLDSGKVTVSELMSGIVQASDTLDEKFSKRVVSAKEKWEEFKESAAIAIGGTIDFQSAVDELNKKWERGEVVLHSFEQVMMAVRDGDYETINAIKEMGQETEKTSEAVKKEFEAMVEADKANKRFAEALDRVKTAAGNLIPTLQDLIVKGLDKLTGGNGGDPWGTEKMHTWATVAEGINAPIRNAKEELAALTEAYSLHQMTAKQFSDRQRELLTTINAGYADYMRVLDGIKQPQRDFSRDSKILADLLDRGRITTDEYRIALSKLETQFVGMDISKMLEGAGDPYGLKNPKPQSMRVESDAYAAELQKEVDAEIAAQKAIVDAVEENQSAVLRGLEKIWDANEERTKKWKEQLKEIHRQDGGGILGGIEKGFTSIYNEVNNVAASAEKVLVNAFHNVEEALVQAALTGEFSWSKMIDQMLADLTRLAIRQLIMAGLNAYSGGAVGAGSMIIGQGGAHADGGSYTEHRAGGTDSQVVLFRMSPGERADFTPRGQTSSSGGGGGNVRIQNVYDPRALLSELDTPHGQKAIINVIRRNPSAFRGMLNR